MSDQNLRRGAQGSDAVPRSTGHSTRSATLDNSRVTPPNAPYMHYRQQLENDYMNASQAYDASQYGYMQSLGVQTAPTQSYVGQLAARPFSRRHRGQNQGTTTQSDSNEDDQEDESSSPPTNYPSFTNYLPPNFRQLSFQQYQRMQSMNYASLLRQAQPAVDARANSSTRPQFRTKVVCELSCKYCQRGVCRRGMKAILLADMAVELFSTDMPPTGT